MTSGNRPAPRTFALVHGARRGGWCRARVRAILTGARERIAELATIGAPARAHSGRMVRFFGNLPQP